MGDCKKCLMRKKSMWNISNQFPEDQERVLVKLRNGWIEIAARHKSAWFDEDGNLLTGVIKWKPL